MFTLQALHRNSFKIKPYHWFFVDFWLNYRIYAIAIWFYKTLFLCVCSLDYNLTVTSLNFQCNKTHLHNSYTTTKNPATPSKTQGEHAIEEENLTSTMLKICRESVINVRQKAKKKVSFEISPGDHILHSVVQMQFQWLFLAWHTRVYCYPAGC